MPKNKVNDLITDQEITFATLILSGSMTDQQAAKAAGLNPNTAAYTKSKPSVRAYMLEHRARLQQQLIAQETEELRRQSLSREQVLARLWEIANLSPEMTRNSITSQVRAIAMIIAIEGLIPDRRANSAERKAATPAVEVQTTAPNSNPLKEKLPRVEPAASVPTDRSPVPLSNPVYPSDPGKSAFVNRAYSSDAQSATRALFSPGIRFPFSIQSDPYARCR